MTKANQTWRVAACATFTLALCTSCGLGERQEAKRDLTEAREKWEASGVSSYEMTVEAFCPDIATGPADVLVENNRVVAVYEPGTTDPKTVFVLGGDELTPAEISECYRTIDELFESYEETLSRGLVRAELSFDPGLGYPTRVVFDATRRREDDSYVLEITSLVPYDDLNTNRAALRAQPHEPSQVSLMRMRTETSCYIPCIRP